MDSNSKNIFNLYKKLLNEAAGVGEGVPFAKALKNPSANKIQNQAKGLKDKTSNLAQQAEEPDETADEILSQAQPMIAAANKEAKAFTKKSFLDLSNRGSNILTAWTRDKTLTDFPEMSVRQVKEQVELAYGMKGSFLLIGDPGIGKSSLMAEVAEKIAKQKGREYKNFWDTTDEERDIIINDPTKYFVFIDFRLAEARPDDILGVPFKLDKPYTRFTPPVWAYMFTRPGIDGFLFMDEFNQGSTEVKNASFKIVLDRALGDKRMAKDVGIVAACNMGEIYGNDPISPANLNRFAAGVLVVDPEEWKKYAVEAGISDAIIAFTKAMPEGSLYTIPEGENPFVTPRTLTQISRGIDYIMDEYNKKLEAGGPVPPDEEIHRLIKMYAGTKAGVKWAEAFYTFVQHILSFDIKKIIKDPKTHLKDKPLNENMALVVFVVNKLKIAASNAKASGGSISPEDREIMTALANIMNHLSPEASCIMFEHLNKDVPKDVLGFLLDFITDEPFDPKIKKEFLDNKMPQITEIIAGKPCKR